jgi:hypothetical protein
MIITYSICVGHNVAERSILINSAILLWTFNIRAPDARPDKVDTLAFNSAANSHPLPFKAWVLQLLRDITLLNEFRFLQRYHLSERPTQNTCGRGKSNVARS